MVKRSTFFIVVAIICLGFGIGIYLQDLKHRESTAAYWKANRHNVGRFTNIQKFVIEMDGRNWPAMRDSIYRQMDTIVILRFRKEMDSLNTKRETKNPQ
ncbi:MAG: hypothetical protein MUO53_10995 [Maribacter sp.]|nr:hypothetical protein [Maribacter sp.]